jgi:DNA-binding transcriptional regulator GbsR (MarR family)
MKMEETKPPHKETLAAQDRFVLEWGRMSSSWGINRTMAQLHALLLVTGDEYTMDDAISRLHISRGNASMNLRDLTDWGVVTRTRAPGDRKDLYVCDDDVIGMIGRVVRERKRREIDPTIAAIRECLAMVPEDDDSVAADRLRQRLQELLVVFNSFDRLFDFVFGNDRTLRALIDWAQTADLDQIFPKNDESRA